jgi:hypothetical protein
VEDMRIKFFILYILIIFFPELLLASELTAKEIMNKADKVNRSHNEVTHMRMDLVNSSGDLRQRDLIWYRKDKNNGSISVLKFNSPANVRDVGIMVEENDNGNNTIWQYTPVTRNIRRIPGSHKQNRFMGTEMVFEDFEGFKLNDYTFRLLKSVDISTKDNCYVIEAIPATLEEKEATGYSKKIFLIDKDKFILHKTSLYDRNGTLSKVFEMINYKFKDGYWRSEIQTMSNLQTNCKTRMTEIKRKINDDSFDPYYVSQRYLRSG